MTQPTPSTPVSAPRPGENTWLWLVKIVTGPLLVLILILHLAVNHYLGSMPSGLMTYADVVRYYHNPLIPLIEIIFLVTVVTHSLLGLRSILLDLNPPHALRSVADWLLGLFGIGTVIYGTWLVLTIASRSS